jgi:hypothetical protein
MKIICFDTTFCGFEEDINSTKKESNIDLNQKVIKCPECKESIALITQNDFEFNSKSKLQINLETIQLIESLIKL